MAFPAQNSLKARTLLLHPICAFAILLLAVPGSVYAQAPPSSPSASAPVTLPAAIAEALAANPSAHASTQQRAQAQARLAQAEAQRKFQVTLNTTTGLSNASVYQPPPSRETFGTLQNTLSVPIPLGPRPRLAVTTAQHQVAAADAQVESARLALAAQVTTAYFDVLRKRALQEVAAETLAQAKLQQESAQKRFQAGDVPELDVLRAQVPVASAQAAVYQAETDLTIARQALNSLLGRPLADGVEVADIALPPAEPPYTREHAVELALANSPDVRAVEAQAKADEAALASARHFRDPSLALQASDTRSKDVTGFSREDALQASITLPLTDGGLGKAQVQEAVATLEQSRAQVLVARRAVETAIVAAYEMARNSRRQVEAAATVRDIAQTSYDKTARGYASGLFPQADVLTAQATLNQARIAYTQAVYDAAAAANVLTAAVEGAAAVLPASTGTTPAPPPPAEKSPASGSNRSSTP